MSVEKLNGLLLELQKYHNHLNEKFLEKYIPAVPEQGPEDYSQDVKAFCLLVHGSIEEFCESVALIVVDHAVDQWRTKKILSTTLVTMALMHAKSPQLDDDKYARIFDLVRVHLDAAKGEFSKFIDRNHGITIRHLNSIFFPAGLEVTDDPKLIGSLDAFIKARGAFAHRMGAKKIPAPEDVRAQAQDCITLCERVKAAAELLLLAASSAPVPTVPLQTPQVPATAPAQVAG